MAEIKGGGTEVKPIEIGAPEAMLIKEIGDQKIKPITEMPMGKAENALRALFEKLAGIQEGGPDKTETDVPTYPPNSTIEIDGVKYKTDDNGKPYQQFDSEKNEWVLMPNAKYELNGHSYETDGLGRIISVEGDIVIKDGDRKTINTGIPDMKDTDQRGHIIGDKFNGDNGLGNLLPMDAKLNDGDFKKFENELKAAVKAGNDVHVKIEPQYSDDSKRPTSFKVTYTINGVVHEKVFINESKQGE